MPQLHGSNPNERRRGSDSWKSHFKFFLKNEVESLSPRPEITIPPHSLAFLNSHSHTLWSRTEGLPYANKSLLLPAGF